MYTSLFVGGVWSVEKYLSRAEWAERHHRVVPFTLAEFLTPSFLEILQYALTTPSLVFLRIQIYTVVSMEILSEQELANDEALRIAKLREQHNLDTIHHRNRLARHTPYMIIYVFNSFHQFHQEIS